MLVMGFVLGGFLNLEFVMLKPKPVVIAEAKP
jgi:hypothetical protein